MTAASVCCGVLHGCIGSWAINFNKGCHSYHSNGSSTVPGSAQLNSKLKIFISRLMIYIIGDIIWITFSFDKSKHNIFWPEAYVKNGFHATVQICTCVLYCTHYVAIYHHRFIKLGFYASLKLLWQWSSMPLWKCLAMKLENRVTAFSFKIWITFGKTNFTGRGMSD